MNAVEVLEAARAAGIELGLDGDDLLLAAAAPPPAALLDLLSLDKAGIVALLRPGRDGWSAEDWQAYFDERAGIAEFDGGLPRPDAVSPAVVATMPTMRCCRMASSRPAMSGCIPAAGPLGTLGAKPRPSPPSRR